MGGGEGVVLPVLTKPTNRYKSLLTFLTCHCKKSFTCTYFRNLFEEDTFAKS